MVFNFTLSSSSASSAHGCVHTRDTISMFKASIIFRIAASAAAASYFTGLVAPHTGLGQTTSPTFRPRTCTCSCLHTHPIAPTLILSTSYAFSIAAEHIAISCISLPRSSTLKWCISSAPGTFGTRITHGHVESSFSNTSHRPRSTGICFGATGSDDSVRGCVRMVADGQNARDERVVHRIPFAHRDTYPVRAGRERGRELKLGFVGHAGSKDPRRASPVVSARSPIRVFAANTRKIAPKNQNSGDS